MKLFRWHNVDRIGIVVAAVLFAGVLFLVTGQERAMAIANRSEKPQVELLFARVVLPVTQLLQTKGFTVETKPAFCDRHPEKPNQKIIACSQSSNYKKENVTQADKDNWLSIAPELMRRIYKAGWQIRKPDAQTQIYLLPDNNLNNLFNDDIDGVYAMYSLEDDGAVCYMTIFYSKSYPRIPTSMEVRASCQKERTF